MSSAAAVAAGQLAGGENPQYPGTSGSSPRHGRRGNALPPVATGPRAAHGPRPAAAARELTADGRSWPDSGHGGGGTSEDEQLARALAASMGDGGVAAPAGSGPEVLNGFAPQAMAPSGGGFGGFGGGGGVGGGVAGAGAGAGRHDPFLGGADPFAALPRPSAPSAGRLMTPRDREMQVCTGGRARGGGVGVCGGVCVCG